MLLAILLAVGASAIILDGLRDPEYGEPLSLQTVKSSIRHLTAETLQVVGLYTYVEANPLRLFLFVAANIDRAFVKLHVFFEGPAGERTLTSRVYDDDRARQLVGLTFDFSVQFHLFARVTGNGSYAASWVDRDVSSSNPPTIYVPVVSERTAVVGEISGTNNVSF